MATKKYVSLEKLGLYDEKIKAKIAADDAAVLASANEFATNLGSNYDVAGAAATEAGKVQTNLNTEINRAKDEEARIEGLVNTAQDEVDALELVVADKADKTAVDALAGKIGTVPEGSTVMGIITNIQESAYDDTDLRADMTTELAKKADKTQVATDIENAVKAEEEARIAAVSGVQDAVDALSQTHATDKGVLEGVIALKADQSALEEVSAVANAAVKQSDYDTKVAALEAEDERIAGLVATEQARAEGVEAGIVERLVEVETFFKTAEGETLDTALDTLVEIQKYLDSEGEVADQMLLDIADNKKAIEDHVAIDHDFAGADATLKAELEGKINAKADSSVVEGIDGRVEVVEGKVSTLESEMDTVEGKVSTLEGQMTTVQGAVATKVEQEAYNTKITALENEDTAIKSRLDDVEALMGDGEGSVADQIADAKTELQGELATAIEAAKTDASNKDAVVLAEAQNGIDAVQTALDTHTGNGDIHVTTTDKTKWNAALQAGDIVAGTANGTISVKGTDVAVTGLGTAAYKADTAFDASGSAAQALTDAKTYTDTAVSKFVEVSEEEILALFNTTNA